jgi:hypothetical protein
LQTDNRRRPRAARRADRTWKEHRGCHRLGDDFVGLQLPTQRAGKGPDNACQLPWVNVLHELPLAEPKEESGTQLRRGPMAVGHPESPLATALPLAASSSRSWRCYRGSPLSSAASTMGETALQPFLEYFSGVKVRPTSCGCQEANTTYCYFTTQNRNQTSNGVRCPRPLKLQRMSKFPNHIPGL